jgi:hypothetical protein
MLAPMRMLQMFTVIPLLQTCSLRHLQVHMLDFSPASSVVERKVWNESVRRIRIWFVEALICWCLVVAEIVPFHDDCYYPPLSDILVATDVEQVQKGSDHLEAMLQPAATGVWHGHGLYAQHLATTCASSTPVFATKVCHRHWFLHTDVICTHGYANVGCSTHVMWCRAWEM